MAEYVQVYTAHGQLDAEMIRIFLQSNEIPAEMYGESVGSIYGLTVGPLGEIRILVPAEYASEATRLLADMEAGLLVDTGQTEQTTAENEEDQPD